MALYSDVDFTIALMATKRDDDTNLRANVARALRTVSRRVDGMFPQRGKQKRPYFEPYIEQRLYPVRRIDVNSLLNTFDFTDPLLELTALTYGALDNQMTLSAGSDAALYPPLNVPAHQVRLLNAGRSWYDRCNGGALYSPASAYLTGIWGMHRDYANAWVALDTLGQAIATTTATAITVGDADGVDEFGFTPRFSEGQLIRVDDEYMEVIGTDTYDSAPTNVLTVRRGVNGTTAATHLLNAPVYIWRLDDSLRRVVSRQAGMIYGRQGAYTTIEVTREGSEIRYPADLLVELKAALEEFAYGN